MAVWLWGDPSPLGGGHQIRRGMASGGPNLTSARVTCKSKEAAVCACISVGENVVCPMQSRPEFGVEDKNPVGLCPCEYQTDKQLRHGRVDERLDRQDPPAAEPRSECQNLTRGSEVGPTHPLIQCCGLAT